jgi:hypothetical protein
VTICKLLSSWRDDTVGNSNSLETVYASGWVCRESFMDRTTPIGKIIVGESINARRGGNNMDIVIAIELAANFKGAEV